MIASRNPLFSCRTISSSVVSFSSARSRTDAASSIFPSLRNRSYVRRNDRAEEGVFADFTGESPACESRGCRRGGQLRDVGYSRRVEMEKGGCFQIWHFVRAAALAANILEFARFELKMKHADKCWLYSSKGMRAVLRRLSVEVEGYRFLCPWKEPEGRRLDREHLKGQLEEAFSVDNFRDLYIYVWLVVYLFER